MLVVQILGEFPIYIFMGSLFPLDLFILGGPI